MNLKSKKLENNTVSFALNKIISSSKKRNFKESIDLTIKLKSIDLSNPKNRIQEDIVLPFYNFNKVTLCFIGSSEISSKIKNIVDYLITPEELNSFTTNKKGFKKIVNKYTYFLSESTFIPLIGKQFGQILSPRGKMPRPILPGSDPSSIIETLKKTISVRSKDKMSFHASVGKIDMPQEEIISNINTVIKRIESKLENGPLNISNYYLKTTMGSPVSFL